MFSGLMFSFVYKLWSLAIRLSICRVQVHLVIYLYPRCGNFLRRPWLQDKALIANLPAELVGK